MSARSSASYRLDANTFILDMEVTAVGNALPNVPAAITTLGIATAMAEITALWLYTEQPAIISVVANPLVGAAPTTMFFSRITLDYFVGEARGGCSNNRCWGLTGQTHAVDTQFAVAPGEMLAAGAQMEALGRGDWEYGTGSGGGTLRMVVQAWADDGSPVPLQLTTNPPTSIPEPASMIFVGTGLALTLKARRNRRAPSKTAPCARCPNLRESSRSGPPRRCVPPRIRRWSSES